jgi:nucleoside-diphosphate kinase
MERTFTMVKPDGVARALVGEVIRRYEAKGLKLIALRMRNFTAEDAAQFYAEHQGKGFYQSLVDLITAGPSVGMVLEGPSAVKLVRTLVGSTNPQEAAPGTIRGDLGLELPANIVHASDAPASYTREARLFFGEELVEQETG